MTAQTQHSLDTAKEKVILIVLDGLEYQTARDCLGFMQSLVDANHATVYKMQSNLPSLSRPLYETILTGTTPLEHGVVHNQISRLTNQTSVFKLAREAHLKTAAAAYSWVSELYNRAPYVAPRDRHTHDESLEIQHGIFYSEDRYPDSHLFADAEYLRMNFDPDFLLIHPMNIDDAGHKAGLDSALYRNTTRRADVILADYLPAWMQQGYQIMVTADHGMNNDFGHGGTLGSEQGIPFYVIGDAFSHDSECALLQTEICGNVCELLGAKHAKSTTTGLLNQEKN